MQHHICGTHSIERERASRHQLIPRVCGGRWPLRVRRLHMSNGTRRQSSGLPQSCQSKHDNMTDIYDSWSLDVGISGTNFCDSCHSLLFSFFPAGVKGEIKKMEIESS